MAHAGFIGIDQGSSSTKAVVIDTDGTIVFRDRKELPAPFREGPRVEQDPAEILASVRHVLYACAKYARSSGLAVLGIGLSCQRSSCLIWNEASGEPLSPVLSWRDTRGHDVVNRLSDRSELIFGKTGLPLTPYYAASKFLWLKDHHPAAGHDQTVFGTLSSFLVQRLTEGRRAVVDHANAARTQLMDIQALTWDEELTALFGLSGIKLPELRPTTDAFGTVRTPEGDIPLCACVGDQQAAMIGLGVLEKGDGGINYGTGGFLMVNTGNELVRAQALMSSVLYSTQGEKCYLLEGSVNAVGDSLEWLRTRLGLFSVYDEVDDLCWKATTDVVAFIGLNGTGAPHWETGISSSLHGMTEESAAADIVRGTVECAAFFMKDIAEEMRRAGVEASRYSLAGGLSSLSYLVQIQADLLGKELRVSSEQEVSARGAALLAGMQQGAWSPKSIKDISLPGETVSAGKNPVAEKRYRRWRELHRMTGILDRMP
jgi:glycerol kinase